MPWEHMFEFEFEYICGEIGLMMMLEKKERYEQT